MKKRTRIAAFALALCICAVSAAGCGDKKAADNSSYDKAEKTTTAAVTEEAATEAAQTTEEITTEAVTEAAKEAAVPEGLSDKYADLDNRSFIYNGHLFTLGKTTMQEMIDAGVEIKKIGEDKLNEEKRAAKSSDDSFHKTIEGKSISFEFINVTNSAIPARDCVLCKVHLLLTDIALWGEQLEAATDQGVEIAVPSRITKDELIANSGEPTRIDDELNRVDYLVDSQVFNDNSGYRFFFNDGQLSEVRISWLP